MQFTRRLCSTLAFIFFQPIVCQQWLALLRLATLINSINKRFDGCLCCEPENCFQFSFLLSRTARLTLCPWTFALEVMMKTFVFVTANEVFLRSKARRQLIGHLICFTVVEGSFFYISACLENWIGSDEKLRLSAHMWKILTQQPSLCH